MPKVKKKSGNSRIYSVTEAFGEIYKIVKDFAKEPKPGEKELLRELTHVINNTYVRAEEKREMREGVGEVTRT